MKSYQDLKVGFVGCGKIAHFHADVFKALGVGIESVCYRSNEENARAFTEKYHIPLIFNDWRSLLGKSNIDFLWVVPSWDQIDIIFEDIIETGIPAFFEKPISLRSEKVEFAISKFTEKRLKHYQIGYNRRFYTIINNLKKYLLNEKIVAVTANLPETINGLDDRLVRNRLIQNSSHLYDTLLFLFGLDNIEVRSIRKLSSEQIRNDHFMVFDINGIPISVLSIWNSPQNYAINIYTESEKLFSLSPFEELNIYKGFDIMDPTEKIPIRKYLPKKIESCFENCDKYKPGFELQVRYFLEYTLNGNLNTIAHGMHENVILLKLLERIMKTQ